MLKFGLVLKYIGQSNALVSASFVENAVRRLMETKEADEMRERAVRLKNAIHRSLDEDRVSRMEMDILSLLISLNSFINLYL